MTLIDRLADKVEVADCWTFKKSISKTGYAYVQYQGQPRLAHRAVYEELVGPIPEGMTIDHLCKVRHCVNPDHLEPVTLQENSKRSRKVRCKRGHLKTVQRTDGQGWRCRQCDRMHATISNAKRQKPPILGN